MMPGEMIASCYFLTPMGEDNGAETSLPVHKSESWRKRHEPLTHLSQDLCLRCSEGLLPCRTRSSRATAQVAIDGLYILVSGVTVRQFN